MRGKGQNQTDIRVNLRELDDPEKETLFENCVADVNIPVGEDFQFPVWMNLRNMKAITASTQEQNSTATRS